MDILLHVCCGPCVVYPLQALRKEGHQVFGYFYNPNIHPFKEFGRRIEALEKLCRKHNFEVEFEREYGLRDYLRRVVYNEERRCLICYKMRLLEAVRKAKETGADAFSTTLLYSRYQQHETIRQLGIQLAEEYGVDFFYQDFREGWQEGIDMSIELGIYRQPYCGCIYSEQERYDKKFRNKKTKKQ